MKTTVEIDDELLKAAKKRAIDEGRSLRRFLELAIRDRLSGASGPGIYGGFATRADLYDEATFDWLEEFEAEVQKQRVHRSDKAKAS
jgi:hypothetical protein